MWDSHVIRPSKNASVPSGRPKIMYMFPELYRSEDCLSPVDRIDVQLCQNNCIFRPAVPCDTDIYNVCNFLMVGSQGFFDPGLFLYSKFWMTHWIYFDCVLPFCILGLSFSVFCSLSINQIHCISLHLFSLQCFLGCNTQRNKSVIFFTMYLQYIIIYSVTNCTNTMFLLKTALLLVKQSPDRTLSNSLRNSGFEL